MEGRQDLLPPGGAGGGHMGLNEGAELGDVVRLRQGVRHHLVLVEAHIEVVLFVQHIGDAAGHPGCEVLSRGAEDHAAAAGHVLAAMVPHALHHGDGAGVADAEPLAGHPVDERLAGGGAIQSHVAHDDVLAGVEGAVLGWIEYQLAAGEALAQPIVAVALQLQGQSFGDEGAEGLASAAMAGDDIAVVRQGVPALPGDLGAEQRAEGPVRGGDGELQPAGPLPLQRLAQFGQQHALIQGPLQIEVVNISGIEVGRPAAPGIFQQAAEVQGLRPVGHQLLPDPQ